MRPIFKKNSLDRRFRKGAAAVEFAVIAPLIVLIVTAIIEITSAIYMRQSLTIAAYEGARVALLPKSSVSNVIAASNRILDSRRIKGATVSVLPSNFQTAKFGDPIQVEVKAPLEKNGFFYRFFSIKQSFTTSVAMMKEF
ncbi:MAG: TadE/TadG family type IV pilus assembly protein [Pirellula sp.]|jgi:hypothetical protein